MGGGGREETESGREARAAAPAGARARPELGGYAGSGGSGLPSWPLRAWAEPPETGRLLVPGPWQKRCQASGRPYASEALDV